MARTATAKTAPTTTNTATEAPTAPALNAAARAELREIAVADITTNGRNPRTLFDLDGEAGIRELAASITAHGLVQPITVRANLDAGEDAPPYLLVAGERRLRAIRDMLKRRTIAAIIRHDLTEDTALEATVLENLQRRDLHPMEEAHGLAALRARPGYTVEQIAKKLGRGKEWVKDRLKLCDLPATTQDLYLRDTTGRLTLTKMLRLHEYTHGNRDNKGFPRLIEAMAADIATGVNKTPIPPPRPACTPGSSRASPTGTLPKVAATATTTSTPTPCAATAPSPPTARRTAIMKASASCPITTPRCRPRVRPRMRRPRPRASRTRPPPCPAPPPAAAVATLALSRKRRRRRARRPGRGVWPRNRTTPPTCSRCAAPWT